MTCRLFSQNCRGLANKDKRNETMHWLANHVKGPFDLQNNRQLKGER